MRFGQWRGLNGDSHYLTFEEIINAETKIRLQHIFEKKISLKNFQKAEVSMHDIEEEEEEEEFSEKECGNFEDLIIQDGPLQLAALNVAGAAAACVAKKERCTECRNQLCLPGSKGAQLNCEFMNYLQRGGLIIPTQIVEGMFKFLNSLFKVMITEKLESFLETHNQSKYLIDQVLKKKKWFKNCSECQQEGLKLDLKVAKYLANTLLAGFAHCHSKTSASDGKRKMEIFAGNPKRFKEELLEFQFDQDLGAFVMEIQDDDQATAVPLGSSLTNDFEHLLVSANPVVIPLPLQPPPNAPSPANLDSNNQLLSLSRPTISNNSSNFANSEKLHQHQTFSRTDQEVSQTNKEIHQQQVHQQTVNVPKRVSIPKNSKRSTTSKAKTKKSSFFNSNSIKIVRSKPVPQEPEPEEDYDAIEGDFEYQMALQKKQSLELFFEDISSDEIHPPLIKPSTDYNRIEMYDEEELNEMWENEFKQEMEERFSNYVHGIESGYSVALISRIQDFTSREQKFTVRFH